jgi:hypothetical protein
MLKQLVPPFLIWATAFVSQLERLHCHDVIQTITPRAFGRTFSLKVTKRLLAQSLISLATLGLVWQLVEAYRTAREIKDLKKVIGVANSKIFNEASGGTTVGDYAYIVDDESPIIFRLKLRNGAYEYDGKVDLIRNDPTLSGVDLQEPGELVRKLNAGGSPLSQHIMAQFDAEAQRLVRAYSSGRVSGPLQMALVANLNRVLAGPSLFDEQRFEKVKLSDKTQGILGGGQSENEAALRLNRLLLEEAYPVGIAKSDRVLTDEDVDDFEAIAGYDGKLYLITSHSNTSSGKNKPTRERLLEVTLPSPDSSTAVVTDSAVNLRDLILEELVSNHLAEPYKNKEGILEYMQVEGFAIDAEDTAYIALRAPLSNDNQALVLEAKLKDLFAGTPRFKTFAVDLQAEGKSYGIVSLDYDRETGAMMIVGNAPDSSENYLPLVCVWHDFAARSEGAIQHADSCKPIGYPGDMTTKPELLLLPPRAKSDQVFTFLDTDNRGDGGMLPLIRGEWGE